MRRINGRGGLDTLHQQHVGKYWTATQQGKAQDKH
jgi:hypothetical protein